MDAEGFHLNISLVGNSGIVLSPERRAALETSLVILQNQQKFNRVFFWGKILGIKDDYFIAQGVGDDEMMDRKTLYSTDCVTWSLVPQATTAMKEQCSVVKGRFTGDPSYEYEHTEIKRIGEGEDAQEEENTITIKEEDRLASVISQVDEDVAIVPRGAYIKAPSGTVIRNRSFQGLEIHDAVKLSSYFHFREPVRLNQKSLLDKADLDKAIDFLDAIDEDVPKRSWSLQLERGSGLIILRSLLWEGLTFYHVPGTTKYGYMYNGSGEMNKDLPFML
ncbi:radial spoke head 9 homolog-like [Saccoglossus kowalevskii]|uniref:Radial spoke head protein 9 homolog n=1 Tax=Saccoglossus kowalevskii TaxID=10224 RepID=A0ABM0GGV6_SACKO|nr:radial spoke head 9 homolog-like [Saccoglossus kowalevskii]